MTFGGQSTEHYSHHGHGYPPVSLRTLAFLLWSKVGLSTVVLWFQGSLTRTYNGTESLLFHRLRAW
jgi:hypothetical protein